jgi:cellulose synthase/poly-beta-1,6-N-acetylglucosamine synthase-like glycosyltransferase
MELISKILFWISIGLFIHIYFLYPLSIWIIWLFRKKNYISDPNYRPLVSVLISVFNEEKVIEKTIRTLFASDYPSDKIEVIVGSDNSSDSSNNILMALNSEFPQLKAFLFNERRGKARVLNDLVKQASGEILVFCDANTIYMKDSLKNLLCEYKDERVGGISGKLVLQEYEESINSGTKEKTYWDLETLLKEKEGELGKLIGANGGIYSIRKELFTDIPIEHPVMDDFYLSMKILEKKKDFLYKSKAIAEELTAPDIKAEFRRKIRNNSINLSTVRAIKKILLPSYGLASYGLWSHKIIRWYSPVILLLIFASNFFLIYEDELYKNALFLQIIIYLLSLVGYVLQKIKIRIVPFQVLFYFVMTNVAMLIGIIKFITGRQTAFWQSTPR